MSLAAKATYLAEKVRLVKEKIDPLISWYDKMKNMGLDELSKLATDIQDILISIHEYDNQIDGLINIDPISTSPTVTDQVKSILSLPGNKIGPKGKVKLLAASRSLDRGNKKLESLKEKLISYRVSAVNNIVEMMENSLKGVSGIDVNIQVTDPDPVTGNGGSIIPILTPKLIDESTSLVDQTLTDPSTVVNSNLVVTGAAGPYPFVQATGIGVANGIVVA